MVRLNKNILTEQQLNNLFSQFTRITSGKEDQNVDLILSEILGKEERIMIAKRLATIILIVEGKSLYSISKSLKISPTTAERIKHGVDNNRYQNILRKLGKSKRGYFEILGAIDAILHLGGILPHYGIGSEGWNRIKRE